MRDAMLLPLQRLGPGVALILLLAAVTSAQRSPLPPPPPVAPALAAIEKQLNNLTNEVAGTISDKFSFCVADPQEDWNEAFNYTSNLEFVDRCLTETQGDLPQRLCTPDEVKFYFSSLYDRDGDKNINLKTNINCNISSWGKGCDPGWACATDPVPDPRNRDRNSIPLRRRNCQACCEGFFCPRGLTCMLPCPLGSYCPRATANDTTGLCDP
ncbi:unnamed protein product [Urochloa humidicola]